MSKEQKLEELRKKLFQMDEKEFNQLLNDSFNITQKQVDSQYRQLSKTDFLKFKPEKIKELAKQFINAQQMIDYKGENEDKINAAGRYIQYNKVERPEWFESIYEGESLEECLIIARQYNDFGVFYNKEKRIYQRIYWFLGDEEMKKIFKEWMNGFPTEYSDDIIYSILEKYNTIPEVKKNKDNKKYITELQVEKDKKYPKSWGLYEKMKTKAGNKKGLKRGNYKQRTPAIEKCDLEGNCIETFETWDDVISAGFSRSSVTNAIRGTDGHHKHKGFIWRHKINLAS